MTQIRLIVHDIRSAHNVGSLLRTADCLGVEHVYITGYSPYPRQKNDTRLPHQIEKTMRLLNKTALGAEEKTNVTYHDNLNNLFAQLKDDGFTLVALEQNDKSIDLADYNPPDKVALLLGREVEGVEPALLEKADVIVEIPMKGSKESLNVVQAAAITAYCMSRT